jgi:hypothetical protein
MDEGLKEKLLCRIEKAQRSLDTPCWLWIGATSGDGYGRISWDINIQVVYYPKSTPW